LKHATTKLLKGGLLAMVVLLSTACTSGITARGESSTLANFQSFRTYGFFQPMGIEAGYNSPVFGELFRAAISKEMESRGYQISNHPDIIINVTARVDENIKMKNYTAPYMSGAYYGGPGGAAYGSALGVGVGVGQRAEQVEDVSVFIDLVENSAERIAWQGVAEFEVSDEKAQHLQQTIDETVGKIFAFYTHSAGQ
jgi:hypothetical protein